MADVDVAEALGDEELDRPAEHLVARVAEHPLGLDVGEHDPAEPVHDHDRVGHELEQAAEPRLRAGGLVPAAHRGHVLLAGDDQVGAALGVARAPIGHVDEDEAAVLRATHGLVRGRPGSQGGGQRAPRLVDPVRRYGQVEDRAADGLVARVAEDPLGARAPERDGAVRGHRDERVGRRVDQRLGQAGHAVIDRHGVVSEPFVVHCAFNLAYMNIFPRPCKSGKRGRVHYVNS